MKLKVSLPVPPQKLTPPTPTEAIVPLNTSAPTPPANDVPAKVTLVKVKVSLPLPPCSDAAPMEPMKV